MEAAASESISLFSFCLCVYNNMFYNIVHEQIYYFIQTIGYPKALFIASISALCHISCLKHQDKASYFISATGCLNGIGSRGSFRVSSLRVSRFARQISCTKSNCSFNSETGIKFLSAERCKVPMPLKILL